MVPFLALRAVMLLFPTVAKIVPLLNARPPPIKFLLCLLIVVSHISSSDFVFQARTFASVSKVYIVSFIIIGAAIGM